MFVVPDLLSFWQLVLNPFRALIAGIDLPERFITM
jgi:hypothetical protein